LISNLLEKYNVKSCLNDLHSKFVMCPTDKAANNVSFVCKRLYAKILFDELNDNQNGDNTYTRINIPEEQIVKQQVDFQNNFMLDVPIDMQKLPPIHWIPKQHKNPTGARFIIGSKMSSLKPLGKTITKIFKLIFKMKRGYYRKSGYFTGLKQFWPIDSHEELLKH